MRSTIYALGSKRSPMSRATFVRRVREAWRTKAIRQAVAAATTV